jgi:hypothetical protein
LIQTSDIARTREHSMVISFSRSVSTKLAWILALLLILVMMVQVGAQTPPPGFININCGWSNSSGYADNALRMSYSSDGEFAEGGQNNDVSPETMAAGVGNDQQKTLRSFSNGSRNCYTLPSTIGKKYLLRALFTYGNYDRLNKTLDGSLFLFGLHIGVNFWEAVNVSNSDPSTTVIKEVLTVAPSNSLSVCLINFGSGIPFISPLELRPLEDTMYPFINTSVSVSYFQRYRFGNVTDPITRYPVDGYDRFWERWTLTSYPWINMNTNKTVKIPPSNDAFNVPSAIFQQASTLDTNYSFIAINVAQGPNRLANNNLQLLPIFHFAEINETNPNRTFNIYNNDVPMFSNVSPPLLQMDSMYKSGQFMRNAYGYFFLNKTSSSSLPPLINAFELYSLVRMDNLTTDFDDGKINVLMYILHITNLSCM